jgi:elongation factor Ts
VENNKFYLEVLKMITAELVRELREKTGAGMMDCKKVLTETDGDMEKAAELLRERGIAKAAKKSGRVAAEGLVATYVTSDRKVGSIVEVNAETDFVAKNDEFVNFVNDVAQIVAEKNPADVESLLETSYKETGKTVKEILTEKIATIGENMTIRRFERFESTGLVESYIHGAGKIAVLVDFAKGETELAKDVCMQIAAAKPEYLNREAVPQDRVEKEMEILKAQAMNEGKPAEIAEKMVQGRIGKFYGEICLLDQEFVKDPSIKVGDLIKNKGAEMVRYARFEKGEGIEKKEENFAEEVMKQLQ